MNWLAAFAAVGFTLLVQFYLGRFVRSPKSLAFIRVFLAVLGLSVGTVLAHLTNPEALDFALILVGCAVVHIPAGGVLLLKHWRRETPS